MQPGPFYFNAKRDNLLGAEGISCETLQVETKNDFTGIQNAGTTITVVIRKDKDGHS